MSNPFSQYHSIPPSPTSRADNLPIFDSSTPGYPTHNPLPIHPDHDNWTPSQPPPITPLSLDAPSQLDDFITQLIQCDETYCPYFQELFVDTVYELSRLKFPNLYLELVRCNEAINQPGSNPKMSEDLCQNFFTKALNKALPTLDSLCDAKRFATSDDPLYGYHGMDYPDPFWFEGAGEIWRRTTNGSIKTTIDDCQRVRRTAEQCLLDDTKPNDYCFSLYQHAVMCEPGTNCPYLRLPMVRCTYIHTKVDYQALKDCIDLLPNVELCREGWTPVDLGDHNPSQFSAPHRVATLSNNNPI